MLWTLETYEKANWRQEKVYSPWLQVQGFPRPAPLSLLSPSQPPLSASIDSSHPCTSSHDHLVSFSLGACSVGLPFPASAGFGCTHGTVSRTAFQRQVFDMG